MILNLVGGYYTSSFPTLTYLTRCQGILILEHDVIPLHDRCVGVIITYLTHFFSHLRYSYLPTYILTI